MNSIIDKAYKIADKNKVILKGHIKISRDVNCLIFAHYCDSTLFYKRFFKISKDVLLLKLTYPEPESEPLCYGSYLLFDTAFENPAFFCLERGARRDEMPFLCRWAQSGEHLNYGRCSAEHGEALARCLELYLGIETQGVLKVKPS